jgi:serine phosphatase RsbU (regulator of sigma subunit)
VTRTDEIGQLTRTFNAMSATVKDTTQGLESRVQERTRDLTRSNRALEESQRLIMESIAYAQRVQAGILPGPDTLASAFPDHLLLYLPRDVVSGDFYFVRSFGDHAVAGVIDCMGHGVPGAFVTMTVHAVLSHVLDAVCNTDPARIIAELDRELRDTLHRDETDLRLDSGLDISLCVVSSGRPTLEFAGAGLPLFVSDGRKIAEVKGDLRRVGYRNAGSGAAWTTRTVSVSPTTSLYLVTDGFLDQSGGDKGFGFGRQRFIEMIAATAGLPMREQEAAFASALRSYQGPRAQRDDITVFGFTPAREAGG